MSKVLLLLSLCLALGAVPAEGQVQFLGFESLDYPDPPYVLGSTVEVLVILPSSYQNGIACAFLGLQGGYTPIPYGQLVIPLPLAEPFVLAAWNTVTGPVTSLGVTIPNWNPLIGQVPLVSVVAVNTAGTKAMVSALIPFGPIIEDALF
jgi:hypothetical protein